MKGMDMTGSNTLLLNQTEIKKAVSLYLETKVFSPEYMKNVEVSDVTCNNSNYSQEWTIKLAEKQDPVSSK
jgi:hypothetical protein